MWIENMKETILKKLRRYRTGQILRIWTRKIYEEENMIYEGENKKNLRERIENTQELKIRKVTKKKIRFTKKKIRRIWER